MKKFLFAMTFLVYTIPSMAHVSDTHEYSIQGLVHFITSPEHLMGHTSVLMVIACLYLLHGRLRSSNVSSRFSRILMAGAAFAGSALTVFAY